ncbi:MAG: alpha amylase C-terminal domain-containing protein [Planctomycetaceae bacterium]|nr:alpha amylase C-terminal domain-containing protein [Planctomycetaceae bacterium]
MANKRIGATPHNGGCFFRVWAPNSSRVRVFLQQPLPPGNEWRPDGFIQKVNLGNDGNGYWEADVSGVEVGDLYRFEITNGANVYERLDAAARDVLHSGLTSPGTGENASIVVSPAFDWSSFRTPWFDDWIIYKFHVGSFAGRNDGISVKDGIATFAQVESKLGYIAEMGFSAIELLPVQEFAMERSWGYNPSAFFAPESAYGAPHRLRHLVEQAHRRGLAVVFDAVYNHIGDDDKLLKDYDGDTTGGGIYFRDGGSTRDFGPRPAWWQREVRDYFEQNARMHFDEYNADGLRFDLTGEMDGGPLAEVVGNLRRDYPDKYIVAENHPASRWVTTFGNFCASWQAESHHEAQRAFNGDSPVDRISGILGWGEHDHHWNLVKYLAGCHDDIGDQHHGDAEHGNSNWDKRHRYLVDLFGGRHNFYARAKARLAWALNIAMPGTPLLFMGTESHMGAPEVAWGYWHDGSDNNGDHRFDWSIAGDETAIPMRRLVAAANRVRWDNPALRSNTLIITQPDRDNGVLAFKRWSGGNVVLAVVNLSDTNFTNHGYGVRTDGQFGRWTQILCTQDAAFGGWDGAGNAFHDPETQPDGMIYINLPQWSVVMVRLV